MKKRLTRYFSYSTHENKKSVGKEDSVSNMLQAGGSKHIFKIFRRKFPDFLTTQRRYRSTSSSLLSFCKKPKHLQQIHGRYILHGLHQNPILSSKLIDSYANLNLLNLSLQVFNSITDPNPLLIDSILKNLAKFDEHERILLVYQKMVMGSKYPDESTYPFVLNACSCLLDVYNGRMIHGHVVKLGFDSFDHLGVGLVEMYRSCSETEDERKVFDEMSVEDLISNPFDFEENHKHLGLVNPEFDLDNVIQLLRYSVELNSIKAGRVLHGVIIATELTQYLSINTALLSMYSKLGYLTDARLLFNNMVEKDCVVWNIIISAYSQQGFPNESIELLRFMVKSRIRPDLFTALSAVSSIRQLKRIDLAKQIHGHVMRNGSDYQVSVHNAMIDMYCESNGLSYARKIFDDIPIKTVVSWSSIIKGYINHDQSLDALSLFSDMKSDGIKPDFITVISVLPACVNVGALEQVRYLHGFSIKLGLNSLTSVNTAILISYAKSGCIDLARKLFDEDDEKIENSKDIITWNSMISAYSKHGDWTRCFQLYNLMKQRSGLKPDHVTFLGLLTGCVNSGLVEEGRGLFREMKSSCGVQPKQEHYACMVDLLGRAGDIAGAREIVKTMPFKPDAQVWGPLLSACKTHSETVTAEFAAEKLMEMEPRNAGNYVLLSNIYAAAGKWEGVAKMRSVLRDSGLKKTPGCSWLEIQGSVHEFRVADRSHPNAIEIYALLQNIEFEVNEIKDMSFGEKLSEVLSLSIDGFS